MRDETRFRPSASREVREPRSIAWKVGQFGGPVAVGALWDATSIFVAFWTAAGFLLVSAGVFAVTFDLEPAPTGSRLSPGD